jgi:antiphage defense system Thoeris ThsB-like protein
MARCVFYSFHYKPDCTRAAKVRNMGVVEGNKPASDNDWEEIKKGGDAAIQKWIDDQLKGKSCNVVLIGESTAGRKWISYEIKSAWNNKKGLVGVHIHRLKDLDGNQASKGRNLFEDFTIGEKKMAMSSVVKTYNPPYSDSKDVYNYISENLADWIEEAIEIRDNYKA